MKPDCSAIVDSGVAALLMAGSMVSALKIDNVNIRFIVLLPQIIALSEIGESLDISIPFYLPSMLFGRTVLLQYIRLEFSLTRLNTHLGTSKWQIAEEQENFNQRAFCTAVRNISLPSILKTT